MRFIIQLWSDEARPASPLLVSALARFNEQLEQAGVLLAAEGLVKSESGVRINMVQGERALREGPFLDAAAGLGAGFWIIRAKSKHEAVEWAKRCPLAEGDQLEVRALYGLPELALAASDVAMV
jgi:hypothetical protein